MCGIVGFSGDLENANLLHATKALDHRGPDDSGTYYEKDKKIGLGHTRLSIIDLSPLGHQPMLSKDKSVILIFNGEIYNFESLRMELKEKGYLFKSKSDTEVVLNMYLEYGIDFLSKLNGIFGLAIYDYRVEELFVARDALGVKPVYYYSDGRLFSFSSEIKALLNLIPKNLKLDYEAIQRYMTFLWCPGDGTPASSIKKLLPGEIISTREGKIIKKWKWYCNPQTKLSIKLNNKNNAIKLIHDGLALAVKRQMMADVPVGAFLSGGLDSSAIVAFAAKNSPDIKCFTIEPQGGSDQNVTEDLPYAVKVAKHLNVDLEIVPINAQNIADDIEDMIWQLDEPLADPAPLNVLYISKLAKARGIKVLLSGTGGDDLFTGYRRHLAHRYEKYWSWLPVSVRKGLEDISLDFDQSKTFGRRLSRLFNNAGANDNERLVNYFAWARRSDLFPLYSREMRESINNIKAEKPILDYLGTIEKGVSSMDSLLALEQQFFLSDHNLIYTDKMSMAAGIEVRVPFLDLELVELASKIPDRFKQKGTTGKWILKKAMEPYLPSDVIYRPKTGFGAPLRRWIKKDLREMVGDYLSIESIKERGLFDGVKVQELIANNDSGKRDHAYTIFSLLCVEIWCRKFIDLSVKIV